MTRDIRFLLKTRYARSRALLIGINEYEKASPLSYAVNDAEEMRSALMNDLGFPLENVVLIKNQEATKANILRAYFRFAGDGVEVDDRIIVFFAGHGHTIRGARGEVGFLVPHDGDPNEISTLIKWSELTAGSELIRAKHMLFIMDACYGGLALMRHLSAGSTRFLKDMLLRYSRQVLTAGKADEIVADAGGPLPDHSVFTGHLLEGLRGNAHTDDGVLTANGLMAYVYGKVAKDKNSNQTPHYGYFDGDGDFVLLAPHLDTMQRDDKEDLDTLIVVPFADEGLPDESTQQKVQEVKRLLGSDSSSIQLHDFVIHEVKRFLSGSGEDQFKVQGQFSKEELLDRIARYEGVVNDLALLLACIAQWAQPSHAVVLQKALSRSTDILDVRSGLTVWLSLRWYPTIIELYCAGIAAVAGRRFDSLANIFYSTVGTSTHDHEEGMFVHSVAQAMLELSQQDVFKMLPGHENNYAPLSEYLYKTLQPRLDDVLFLGKGYERAFDEFEVLLAMTISDFRTQRGDSPWGPVGRFGWKGRLSRANAPLPRLIAEAGAAGDNWAPLKAGLFGGSAERFKRVANPFSEFVAGLNWW